MRVVKEIKGRFNYVIDLMNSRINLKLIVDSKEKNEKRIRKYI